jgi:hypothetical protein
MLLHLFLSSFCSPVERPCILTEKASFWQGLEFTKKPGKVRAKILSFYILGSTAQLPVTKNTSKR